MNLNKISQMKPKELLKIRELIEAAILQKDWCVCGARVKFNHGLHLGRRGEVVAVLASGTRRLANIMVKIDGAESATHATKMILEPE
jgi:hypothetical protein